MGSTRLAVIIRMHGGAVLRQRRISRTGEQRFIAGRRREAELFDRFYELGEIHGLHHVSNHSVFIKLDHVRGFAQGGERHHGNGFGSRLYFRVTFQGWVKALSIVVISS